MTPHQRFHTAHHIVRRAMASRYYNGTWHRRSYATVTEINRSLPKMLDTLGVTKRADRGAIRKLVPTVLDSVEMQRANGRPQGRARLDSILAARLIERALRNAPQLPAGAEARHFTVIDRAEGLTLVAGNWWHEYSRRHGSRHHEVALLTGREDGQEWARRVPYRTYSVAGALDYVRPAEVNRAIETGRRVLRQGNIWLVQRARGSDDLSVLRGTRHEIGDDRVLRHPEHGEVDLTGAAWKAFESKDTTRSGRASALYD